MGQMKNHRRCGCLAVLAGFGALFTGGASMAADAPSSSAGQLEEVIVTATRRVDTNLQSTPVSVTAITSGDIQRMVAKDISGLASSVPGFSAARVTAFNAASFAMRGVGITDIIVYQDSPVGVSVDDLSKGFKFLNKNLGEAEDDSAAAADLSPIVETAAAIDSQIQAAARRRGAASLVR